MFMKNAWYVVALSHQVGHKLYATSILGERVVLYRTASGTIIALEDACVHRKLPLSMGRLVDDQVECGYHGMTYDGSGRCTRVPGSTRVPPSARVRSYPTESRYGLVWIWMGEPARADRTTILNVEHWGQPGWGRNSGGSMSVACSYLYITDNLLDPSHVAWVHRSSFGNSACEDEPVQTRDQPSGITAYRWMRDVEVAPFYRSLVRFRGNCDRLQHYEVRYPSHAIIRAVFVPAGVSATVGEAHPDAMIMDSYNFLTPVNEHESSYYWFQMRNFAPDDVSLSASMDEDVRAAFAEDKVVLEAVDRGFREQTTPKLDLAIDRAQLLFRKRLASLIAAEAPATHNTEGGT